MLDLRGNLTAVVITSGEGSFDGCIAALNHQDCQFDINIIRDVAPLNKAFQAALDSVKTEYYVEVDADMTLHRFAIRKLYETIVKEPSNVMMVALPLLDIHLNQAIVGVKIFRTKIVREFPYQESAACEMDQLDRAAEAGYTFKVYGKLLDNLSDCIGWHGNQLMQPRHERDLFARYKRLFERYRLDPEKMGWLIKWPQEFLERYQRNPTQGNLFALLGAASGLTSDLSKATTEKDYRETRTMPEYNILKKHLTPKGPTDLNLYTTAKCNFRCWFCRRELIGVEHIPDMTPEMLVRILKQFPDIKTSCLAGFGEPLMNPHIVELAQELNRYGVAPNLITNGSLLANKIDDLCKAKFGMISVSLNATTQEEHEQIHGVPMWGTVIDGIKKLVRAGFCQVGLSMVVTKQNYKTIPLFIRLGASLGVHIINLISLLPHGLPDDETFWDSVITKEDTEILQEIEKYKHSLGAHLVFQWPVPISRDASLCPHTCDSPWTSVGVDGRGYFSPCRRILPPAIEFMMGAGKSIWTGDGFRDARGSVLGEGSIKDLCDKCWGNWNQ